MKKLLLLLCLTLMLPSFAGAETKIYQFVSGDKNGITDDQKGEWTNGAHGFSFSSNAFPAVYKGSDTNDRGLSTNTTSSITSNAEFNNVTKITVDASSNSTGNSLTVQVGRTQIGKTYSLSKANHQMIEFVSSTPLSGTITFLVTRSSKTVWIAGFQLTTAETSPDLQTAELAFEQEAYEFTLGESFVSPQLVKQVTDGAITYESSNDAVATVSAEAGELTLLSAGTTEITATSAATATYNAGTATYTLTVAEKAKLGAITVNGSVPTTDVPVEVYAELPFVIAAENAESMSVTVKNENAEIIVNEENLATSSYTWTPAAVGSYEVAVSATGCGSTTKVSFTVKVTEQPESLVTGLWKKVTSLDALNDATPYMLAGMVGDNTWYTLDGTIATNNLPCESEKLTAYEEYLVNEKEAGLVNILKVGDSYYNFYMPNVTLSSNEIGGYITCNATESKNKATVLSTKDSNGASDLTMTMASDDGGVTAVFAASTEGTSNRKNFRFNASSKIFACYSTGQQNFYIYEPLTEAIEGTLMENGTAIDTEANFELQYQKPCTLTIKLAPKHTAYWHFEEAPKAETPEQVAAEAESEKVFTEYSDASPIELTEAGKLTVYTMFGKYKSAEKVLTVTGSTTSSISEISADEAAEAEWFDVQGRRVAKPAKGGVYILKQGSKVSKRIL